MSHDHAVTKHARMSSLLNRKRKVAVGMQSSVDPTPGPSSESTKVEELNEKERLKHDEEKKKAREALLREVHRAKQRAELVGPQGWLRPRSLNTNKQFLHRTLAATLTKTRSKGQKSSRDL
ncbi:hypothetical protein KIN20_003490 [Parelaphostrongylus tenuis]|uniref:Uncharacterized protein n=1 Tax=Parelaphostrongylus tenuis TaxID=148309 RepID=A0AAD5M097_PARTN|nr:hypothetical protein KIN20_003490 [Parelaphostrongylus tenuis]